MNKMNKCDNCVHFLKGECSGRTEELGCKEFDKVGELIGKMEDCGIEYRYYSQDDQTTLRSDGVQWPDWDIDIMTNDINEGFKIVFLDQTILGYYMTDGWQLSKDGFENLVKFANDRREKEGWNDN